jgi:hypothetical protein
MQWLQSVSAALALSTVLSLPSHAQADDRWYVQATAGSTHVNGGEYVDRGMPFAQGSIAVRIARTEFVDVLLGVRGESVIGSQDRVLVCAIGSPGQCIPEAPQLTGSSADAALSHQFWSRLTLEGSLGYGWYSAFGRGARVRTAQVDVVLAIGRHLGLAGSQRSLATLNLNGDPSGSNAWLFGLRVH